jgi:hypothetical protein
LEPEVLNTDHGIGNEDVMYDANHTYGSSITDRSCAVETGRKLIDDIKG